MSTEPQTYTQWLIRKYADAALMARDNARESRRLARTGLKLMTDPLEEATAAYKRGLGYIADIRRFKSRGNKI
jgi:hypothetical protein